MKRVALYARVSTLDQHPENQLIELRAYAKARGFENVVEYVDHGVSGAKDRRPALDRLMADVRARRVDALVVTALDRLGRSVRHLVQCMNVLTRRLSARAAARELGCSTASAWRLLKAHRAGAAEADGASRAAEEAPHA